MFTLKVKDKHYRIPDMEKLRQLFEAGKIADTTQIYERAAQQWVTVGEVLERESAVEAEDAPLNEADEYGRTVMAGDDSFAMPKPQPKMTLSDAAFRYDEGEDGARPTAEMPRVEAQPEAQPQAYDPATQFGNVEFDRSGDSDDDDSFQIGEPSGGQAWDKPAEPAAPVTPEPVQEPVTQAPPPGAAQRVAQPVPPKGPKPSGRGVLGRFFGFDILVSSAIIKAIYLFGVLGLTLAAVMMATMGDTPQQLLGTGTAGVPAPVVALVFFLASQIFWRITCEVLILGFSLHDRLVAVENKLDKE